MPYLIQVTANFTPDVTPLVLAAQRNNYEILKMLLDRGATIPMPHDVKCSCEECVDSSSDDSLRFSLARINSYKVLHIFIAPIHYIYNSVIELKCKVTKLNSCILTKNVKIVQSNLTSRYLFSKIKKYWQIFFSKVLWPSHKYELEQKIGGSGKVEKAIII